MFQELNIVRQMHLSGTEVLSEVLFEDFSELFEDSFSPRHGHGLIII